MLNIIVYKFRRLIDLGYVRLGNNNTFASCYATFLQTQSFIGARHVYHVSLTTSTVADSERKRPKPRRGIGNAKKTFLGIPRRMMMPARCRRLSPDCHRTIPPVRKGLPLKPPGSDRTARFAGMNFFFGPAKGFINGHESIIRPPTKKERDTNLKIH